MPEPDPFASPFHHVRLPGEPEPTTGYGYLGPMPGAPEHPVDPYAASSPYASSPYAAPNAYETSNPYATPTSAPNPYAVPVGYPYVSAAADVHVKLFQRPMALLVSSWSWLAATVLVVLVLPALFFLDPDVHAAELYEESQTELEPMTRAEAEIVAQITPMIFAVIFAVLAVPYVVAAIKLRGGRNWPRVVLAVLGALAAVFGLIMLAVFAGGAVPYVNWVAGTVWALLFLAAVFLGIVAMFVPPANAYVRAVSAR
ncbi:MULTISPECIES: DUF308 domain-containing protein [unclassified Saccharothrix]|uniref:DUF308 domain-containing protein n=1 Tax=unclassified Saccharothrix TaxID=2593673 RepID=UPI00307F6966